MAEKREVNFEETISLPEEGEEQELEEKETPPESSQETIQEGSEEVEAESEETEETEEEKEPEVAPTVPEKEPKLVEGETPRERAMRLEMARVKKLLREERSNKMFGDEKPSEKQNLLGEEDQGILNQYDPDEVNNFEKIMDVIAKKKGWVRKEEFQTNTYQTQASDTLDGFLENHPEYLPENDKDNLLWGRFQQEFSLYKRPNNPRDLKKIFEKVHSEVFGITPGANIKLINAQKEKVKVASHSGAAPRGPKITHQGSTLDPALADHLKGFSNEEKKEIFGV